jgi:uncharacterized membrane protein
MKMLLFTAILVGLTAGLFFAWSCSVVPGLGRLPDDQYILAFQSLNRAIQNPVFFLCFIGSVIVLPACAWMHHGQTMRFWLLLAATFVYLVGVIGVTGLGNVPLNEALDKLEVKGMTMAQLAEQRRLFEGPWNELNNWRTGACVVSFVLTLVAYIPF